MATNFDYDAYFRNYRKNHPDKTNAWRYKAYIKYCMQYEKANPERAAELREKAAAEVLEA